MTKRIKAIGRWILWPPAVVLVPLLPIAGVLLVCAFALPAVSEPVRLSAYTLSAYALLVLCLRLPRVIRRGRAVARCSPRIARWQDDAALRFQVALYGSLVWNAAYAALQLGLGVVHASSWYYALAVYYLLLALMRFWLLRSARTGPPGRGLRLNADAGGHHAYNLWQRGCGIPPDDACRQRRRGVPLPYLPLPLHDCFRPPPAQPPGRRSFAREEDLGGPRLLRRGRSLGGPPAQTSPAQAPRFSHTVLQNPPPGGPRRGISLGVGRFA